MVNGQIFVVNLDDTEQEYEEIFYPDLRDFYSQKAFPVQIWNIEELSKNVVFEKILLGSENNMKLTISKDFNIIAWTKYKIDQNVEPKMIIDKIERHFQSIIPIIKIDFIMFTKPEEVIPETQPVDQQPQQDQLQQPPTLQK